MPAVIPVTIPASIVALPFEADHVPPTDASVKVIEAAGQTTDNPAIIPALGNGLTVMIFDAVAVPQELVTIYFMVSIPANMP